MPLKILCVLIICLNTFSAVHGQYQYSSDKTQGLETILDVLSKKYGLHFAYPSELISTEEISIHTEEHNELIPFLSSIFLNTELEFQIQNSSNILLRKKLTQNTTKQETQIGGLIIEESTLNPLFNATVYLSDFSKGTFSDEEGTFTLSLSSADLKKNIIISYIGYEEVSLPANSLQEVNTITLIENTTPISDVIIQHTKPLMKTDLENLSIQIDKKMLNSNQANLVGGGDIFKTIQTLPGITSNDDSAEIKIRGSNAEETLIVLDNIPIYNADHYYGIFSSINSAFVNKVTLYKNIIPTQYGGVNAGLLELESKNDYNKTKGTIDFNFLNTYFNLSTASDKKIVLNLAGRTTIGNVNSFKLFDKDQSINSLESLTEDFNRQFKETDPNFKFYDFNANLSFNFNHKTSISASSFMSNDQYLNSYTNKFQTRRNGVNFENEETHSFSEEWENNGLALTLNHKISEDITLKGNLHHSVYSKTGSLISSILTTPSLNAEPRETDFINENSIQDIGSTVFVEKENTYKVGISWNNYETKFKLDDFRDRIRDISSTSNQISLFGSYTFHLGKLTLNTGSRFTRYSNQETKTTPNSTPEKTETARLRLSPQIIGSYKLSNEKAIKFSIGRNNQFLRSVQYENRVGQFIEIYSMANEEDVPIGSSLNYMLGYSYKKSDWCFDIELFYKDMDGTIEFTNINPGFQQQDGPSENSTPNFRLFQGTSYSAGADFMLTYNSKKYTSWIAYTLSKTENQIKQLFKNSPYPHQNDRRHQLKWINQINLSNWSFSANMFFANGKPYQSFINVQNNEDRESISPADLYEYLPYYGRIDIGAAYSFPLFKNQASISCSIFNLTNRQNVKFIQQTYDVQLENNNQKSISVAIGNESNLLSRSIDLGFKFNF